MARYGAQCTYNFITSSHQFYYKNKSISLYYLRTINPPLLSEHILDRQCQLRSHPDVLGQIGVDLYGLVPKAQEAYQVQFEILSYCKVRVELKKSLMRY